MVPPFPQNSRYHVTPVATLVDSDGNPVRYLRRRFLPDPAALVQFAQHRVAPGDRLDLIATEALQDPELFWRICDANRCLHPDELTAVVGRRLRITLPEGLPGGPL
ncbi:LysM domain-containing protein [Micromonospora sp. AP08]|nr:LysM domain-containing protein [Micromonospora sp. AP08]